MCSQKSRFYSTTACLMIGMIIWCCKKDSPSQPEQPKGIFVQKVAYTSMKLTQNQGPFIAISDLYNDNGVFKLFNRNELVEGIGPTLSPDQSWIIYQQVGNGWSHWRANIDGSNKQKIPVEGNYILENPKISPDGKILAATFLQPGNDYKGRHIGVVPISGGAPRIVYASSGWNVTPAWSPDGKKIYFSWPDYQNRYKQNASGSGRVKSYIIAINVDGTGWQAVSDTMNGFSNDFYPDLAPDGLQIAFTSLRNYPNNIFPEIFIMNATGAGGIARQLTRCAGCQQQHEDHFDSYTMDDKPIWTKDGKNILFERQIWTYNHDVKNYAMQEDIYIINIDGSGLQKLTDDGISSLTKRSVR